MGSYIEAHINCDLGSGVCARFWTTEDGNAHFQVFCGLEIVGSGSGKSEGATLNGNNIGEDISDNEVLSPGEYTIHLETE